MKQNNPPESFKAFWAVLWAQIFAAIMRFLQSVHVTGDVRIKFPKVPPKRQLGPRRSVRVTDGS